jgi:hypothetical protein
VQHHGASKFHDGPDGALGITVVVVSTNAGMLYLLTED